MPIQAVTRKELMSTAAPGVYIVSDEPIEQGRVYDISVDEFKDGATCVCGRVRENTQPWPAGVDLIEVRPDGMMVMTYRVLVRDN